VSSIPNLTWDQFVMLVFNELVKRSLVVEGSSGGSGGGVDPVPLIENHRIDSTDVHGIANTNALVLTSDARLSNARTPVAHAHAESDVTNLITDIAAKADAVHAHSEANVTNLVNDLAGKAASVHSHDAAYYTKAQVDTLLAAVSGGTLDLTPTWLNLTPGPLFEAYPNTFQSTLDCCVYGGHLVHFRGVANCPAGASAGDRIFTLPTEVPAPTAVRRLSPQSGGTTVTGCNVNPDRTVKIAAASSLAAGAFLAFDTVSFVTP
jgi:hypothetical protein